MGKTNIEYGERTWNWYPGCNGPDGKPCTYCFARNSVLPRMKCSLCQTLQPHYHPERMEEPCHVRKPSHFLCCFTGDWMNAPDEIVQRALKVMRDNPRHTFLTLTKQPQNLAKWSPFPENAWVGVSVTNTQQFVEAHKALLPPLKATVRFISFEPLLDPITYPIKTLSRPDGYPLFVPLAECCEWVIIGSQSKPTVMPREWWVKSIVKACDQAGVKVWLKNSLLPLVLGQPWAFAKTAQYPEGHLRQEIPEGGTK